MKRYHVRKKNPDDKTLLIVGGLALAGVGVFVYMNSAKTAKQQQTLAKQPPQTQALYSAAEQAVKDLASKAFGQAFGPKGVEAAIAAIKAYNKQVPASGVDAFGDPLPPPFKIGDNLTVAQENADAVAMNEHDASFYADLE